MTRKLSNELKERRKIVRRWANVMRPIALRHSNLSFTDKRKIEESYFENRTGVKFTNLEDFDMFANYNLGDKAEFVYVRTVAPFDSGEEDKNRNLAGKLMVPISECSEAFGFKSKLVTNNDFIGECKKPAVSFGGYSAPGNFENYIRLVNMAEILVEGALLNAEKNRKRPFKYVISKHPEYKSKATLFPLKNKKDLVNALGIFESSQELNLGEELMMYCSVDNLGRLETRFKKQHGKIFSVNEFLMKR